MTALLIHHNILYETIVSMFKLVISFFFAINLSLISFSTSPCSQDISHVLSFATGELVFIFLREDGERNELDKVFMRHASLKNAVFYIV